MTGCDIPPEQFAGALGELMDSVDPFVEICRPVGLAAECHHMRRAKQIKLGETPLDPVPLEITIATLRQLEAVVVGTRATLEKVDIENRRIVGPTLRLVSSSTSRKSGADHG